MEKKLGTKWMKKILVQLKNSDKIKLVIWTNDMIQNQTIENWPIVDGLITLYSSGYPVNKVISYVNRHRPYCCNNPEFFKAMTNRESIYKVLDEIGVEHPNYLVLNTKEISNEINEETNWITFHGKKLEKPFVEKPIDSENHNIHIYFNSKEGGGKTKIFRKKAGRKNQFYSNGEIRRNGKYIYEEFIEQQEPIDIKVYAIGQKYVYAEKRSSLMQEGLLQIDEYGRELREVFKLSEKEKEFAAKITQAFGQFICGFDIVRGKDGRSVVIDINGWSFVKSEFSNEYFENCGRLLVELFLTNCKK
ncbi:inositol hexakisphosphate and diphosphoinositol-pentakisphosphate kinase [Anaeramoeba flamelloides]|uniref:Inositol hexakisphosphate and diphosphoinositol-pentakisphosphate kinase n=1 Tax=Anaeramoeba flamelloides TaxID=1746091 RepID=A0AAV7Y937_9EUKA|nr:inositol hexakisphosphate and diphosphoinositol-pentakisphosphate kinase [Anaeramoeba flamelloides]KAJ6250532.1 inositol hexakisphosphate and diphosphoinositol-pentakisphosphate kinase [Anaeramoeba flamelloides]